MKYCPLCANNLTEKLIDDVQRKVCSSSECDYLYWDNPVPVVAALVEYENNIILARNAKWEKGLFSLISGYLEKGETPEHAVIREVKEELGLCGRIKDFIGHYSFFKKNQLILAYWVVSSGELRTGEEIAETKIISKEQIKSYPFGPLNLTEIIVEDWLLKAER